MTPLHVASSQGSLAVAKCLISAGADLRSLDEEQMTPLHFACMEGSLEVAKLLFETGMCSKMITQCHTSQHLKIGTRCIHVGSASAERFS